jgi:uncharacterized protein YebE (UPF0316 family)
MEVVLGAVLIFFMRLADVTIGTFRTILVVQAKKYYAALAGFVEVLIWIFAMRYIVDHMDNTFNLIAYAGGFAAGNLMGITLEEKIGLGYIQLNVISKMFADKIAMALRRSKYGTTLLPAEGGSGGMAVIVAIIKRRDQKNVIKLIEEIDPTCFITIQHSRPYRGFIHGARK